MRRDIVTKKIGTLSHGNRQINGKSMNNNGSNVNNEKMEDHENEEDKLLEFLLRARHIVFNQEKAIGIVMKIVFIIYLR